MNRREFLLSAMTAGVAAAVGGAPAKKQPGEVTSFASGDGLVRIKPHVQLLDTNTLGFGWMTSKPASGWVEWRQDDGAWQRAWNEEDGLLADAGQLVHRIEVRGFDPAKPLEYRVLSREISVFEPYRVSFVGEPEACVGKIDAIAAPDGAFSFVMLNDVHGQLDVYPKLVPHFGGPVALTVFNGDIASSINAESDVTTRLLAPLAYVTAQTRAPCRYLRGNHETRGALARRLRDYLPLQNGHYFGSMTAGPVRMAFIDTGEDKRDNHREYFGLTDFDAYLAREVEWLKREIASPEWKEARARIAVMHIPTSCKHRGKPWKAGLPRLAELEAVLATANVTLALGAHMHERSKSAPAKNRPYPMIVGGGPKLDATNPLHLPTATRVDVTEAGVKVSQFDSTGAKVAEWSAGAGL